MNKGERVSLNDMIKSFIANNAYALFLDDKAGTIEVGKYADLVVLEEDLFKVDPLLIDSIKILKKPLQR
ncbi:MAG: amidohydrolase family protein [Bacillota bacterium]